MFSVVIPAYNEAKTLEENVEKLVGFLKENYDEFEIIIAEDGSTDGTDEIARELAERYEFVRHLHSDERLGKGKAVFNGIKNARYSAVVYMDADLSTDLKNLGDLLDALEKGYDIVVGSRVIEASETKRPLFREIPSRVYNLMVRLMLGSKISDHQCGFKAFRKEKIIEIGEKVKDNHWFWDTELLVLAQRNGLRIKEIPVKWRHGENSSVSVFKTSVYLLSRLLRHSERFFLGFSILTALLIFAGLFYVGKPERIFVAFTELNPGLIMTGFAVYPLSFLLRGLRYEMLMKRLGGNISVSYGVMSVAVSQTLNVLTPVRIGDLGRAYLYSRKNVAYQKSFSALTAERIYDIMSVLIIAVVSMVFIGMLYLNILLYGSAFFVLAVLAVLLVSKLKGYIPDIMKDARGLLFSRKLVIYLPISLGIWIIDVFVCYIILMSFGKFSLAISAFAISMGNIVKAFPITPGGIGAYEATLALIISSVISSDKAIAVAIADHAIKNTSTLLLGFFSSLKMGISIREMRE